MEFFINNIDKTAEIWLNNSEKNNADLKKTLESTYKKYKKQKYTVAVFESGSSDLFVQTKDLLKHNRLY